MDSFKVYLETKINFSKEDVEKYAQESGYGADMWIDREGNVTLGHQDGFHRASQRIQLDLRSKSVIMRSHVSGTHVWPRVQQLLQDLIKKGIIDSSWSIKADNIGDYASYGNYKHASGDIEKKNAGDLASQQSRITAVTEDLTFYHGTSSDDWEKIQKVGLHPLGSTFTKGGFESRGKHAGNEGLLYLASKLDDAWAYAKTRTRSVYRAKDPERYKWDQHNSECSFPVKPVVLRVKIPDLAKLRSDDDAANNIMREWAERIWKAKSEEEREQTIDKLIKDTGMEIRKYGIAVAVWRETDAGFNEIANRVPKRVWHKWLASIKRYKQVGYKGFIPARFIELIKFCEDQY